MIKLIEEFEARGHQTTVLFLSKGPDRSDAKLQDSVTDYGLFKNVTFVHLRWRGLTYAPSILSDAVNDIRQFVRVLPYLFGRADLLYFDRAHLGFAAFSSLFHRRVVWRCLGVMSFLLARDSGKVAGMLYLAIARLLVQFPIGLLVCTNDGSPWYRLFRPASRRRLLLLTNGIDCASSKPRNTASGSKLLSLGFVGRTTLAKGLDIFVRMCERLMERKLSFHAVVVGDGKFRAAAERLAAEKGLGGDIKFIGDVPHARIGDYFSEIDIYVTPARNGAFSNTTLEALAAGCCVVALAQDPETGVDKTTMKFIDDGLIRWARRDDPVQGCTEAVAALLGAPQQIVEQRTRCLAFAQNTLVDWSERIRREADLFEQFTATGVALYGSLPSDMLARRAYEVAE